MRADVPRRPPSSVCLRGGSPTWATTTFSARVGEGSLAPLARSADHRPGAPATPACTPLRASSMTTDRRRTASSTRAAPMKVPGCGPAREDAAPAAGYSSNPASGGAHEWRRCRQARRGSRTAAQGAPKPLVRRGFGVQVLRCDRVSQTCPPGLPACCREGSQRWPAAVSGYSSRSCRALHCVACHSSVKCR